MADKEFEPDDPMELVAVELTGGEEDMAACLVEEYIRDGWGDEQLLRLFRDPFYRMTHRIYREKGEAHVRALIEELRRKWGYWNGDDAGLRLRMDEAKKALLKENNRG